MSRLKVAGILDALEPVATAPATPRDVCRVHSPSLVGQIRSIAERGGGRLDLDTIVSPGSYEAALHAAGATLSAARAVLDGQARSSFAVVRPPGHHARPNQAMGFCLFNNIAIATAWALAEGGVGRVAIVDFDVHHGNGTQEAFTNSPEVLYVSLHQYPFYPGTGHWRDTGGGPGEGTCINIPLPPGTGDNGYAVAFDRIVCPVVRRFGPELILVSAGYDAHWADPLAWMLVSLSGFRRMADTLMNLADELCSGRIVFTLEGGYDLTILAHGVATTLCAMRGTPYDDAVGPAREPETPVDPLVSQIARWHSLADGTG